MKKRKILYVIPFAALVLSGCTFQDGIDWLGKNIYEPVKNWIVNLFNPGKKDDPKPTPDPGPGPQPVDKVYTPDEVIALCDQVGAGVVVPDLLKVEGTVALGSKMGDHGWEGKFITEGEKDLVFESANGFASEESLDGATIVLEGYAELFNGKYKVGYLPKDASPTGSPYSPTILSVTQPGEKEIKAITSIDVNTLYTISVGDSISKKDVVANLEYTDGSIGQVTPDYIDYDTSEAGEKALTVHVGNWEGTTYITVVDLPHYTPEQVVALCAQAGDGKVVEGLLRVEGFATSSSFDSKYGWSGNFVTEGDNQLEFGSAATNKEYATLDNKFIQVEGYAELYNGVYKVAYLPATASPTGEKYNPVLVSVETKDVTPESIIITSGNSVGIEQTLLLKASVGPVGSPQDVVWSIESGSEYATLDGSLLTGVAQGTVVVKAAVASNPNISAQMSIAVGEALDPMQVAYEAAAALANQGVTTDEFEFSGVVVGKRGTDDYFVQSGAYGMDVYKPNNADLAFGKEVTVKATLTSYSGTLETKAISSLTVGNDAELPNPVVIDSKATQDATKLNVLAEVTGTAKADVTVDTSKDLTIKLDVNGDEITVYTKKNVLSAAGLANLGSIKQGDTVKFEKVVTGTYNANKQLLPCENSVLTITPPEAADPQTVAITSGDKVYVGADLALTATVGPAGAPQDVEWSIQNGADYATLQGSTLHGVAAGEVVVRATAVGFPDVYKEATITVEAEFVNNIQAAYAAAEALANKAESTEVFTWSGVVVAKRGTDDYFVQSGEYGLDLYKPGNADLAVGKFVKVSSKVSKYNGTLEATSATIISMEDAAIPAATVIDSAAKLSATKLNVLAEVEGTAKADVTVDTSKDLTIKLDVNGDEITVFTKKALFSAAGLADLGTIKAGDTVRFGQAVTGAYNANLQILPCEDTILSVTHAQAADPESVEITSGDSVYVGEDLTLAATVSPSNAPQDVEWSIESGAEYATLSEGKLHGVAAGEVVVKATAKDHADVSATKTVTVSVPSIDPTEQKTYTLNSVSTGGNTAPHNNYNAAADSVQDGVTWSVTGNSNMVPWRLGGGKNTGLDKVDRAIESKGAVTSDDVTKVVVTTGTATLTINSVKLLVGTSQGASDVDELAITEDLVSATLTFARPEGHNWSGRYFTIVYNLTNTTTSNQYAQFVSAEFFAVK